MVRKAKKHDNVSEKLFVQDLMIKKQVIQLSNYLQKR